MTLGFKLWVWISTVVIVPCAIFIDYQWYLMAHNKVEIMHWMFGYSAKFIIEALSFSLVGGIGMILSLVLMFTPNKK